MSWLENLATAVLLPVIAPIAVVTIAYDEITSSSDVGCRWCDQKASRDGLCESCYREDKEDDRRILKEAEKQDDKYRIESEISSFEKSSKQQIKSKYGVTISFHKTDVNIISNSNSKIAHLKNYTSELDAENRDIQTLVDDLQKAKNAI